MSEPVASHDPEGHRYVLTLDGEQIGMAVYHDRGGRRLFVHTEVDPAHGGKGYAGQLVSFAIADVESAGVPIVPLCPYVARWLERHPGHESIVDTDLLAAIHDRAG